MQTESYPTQFVAIVLSPDSVSKLISLSYESCQGTDKDKKKSSALKLLK